MSIDMIHVHINPKDIIKIRFVFSKNAFRSKSSNSNLTASHFNLKAMNMWSFEYSF